MLPSMAIRLPFWKYFRNKLCGLTPSHYINKVGLTLLTRAGEIAVARNAETDHVDPGLGSTEVRGRPRAGP